MARMVMVYWLGGKGSFTTKERPFLKLSNSLLAVRFQDSSNLLVVFSSTNHFFLPCNPPFLFSIPLD